MTKDTGGQAFPIPGYELSNGHIEYPESGMNLRDWFAGMALQGMLASESAVAVMMQISKEKGLDAGEVTTRTAYIIADEMLKERK